MPGSVVRVGEKIEVKNRIDLGWWSGTVITNGQGQFLVQPNGTEHPGDRVIVWRKNDHWRRPV